MFFSNKDFWMSADENKMDLDEYIDFLMNPKKAPEFPHSMYYSEGTKYLSFFQYERALQFLNEAVENDPTSIKSLLKRSKCFIGLKKYEEAIVDAEKVLQLSPNNVHAIDLKGEAQYLLGDFEGGFLTYLEGRKINPANQKLRLGIQICQDALDNSLHPRLGVKYQKDDVTGILKTKKDDKKFQNRLKYRKSVRECFGKDAKFLEDLMADKNLKTVHGFCKEAIDCIRHRERFWSMETPLHSRKKREEIKVKEIKTPQAFEKNIQICNAMKRRAQFSLQRRKFDDCISEATKLLNSAETLLKERENEKMKFKCDAYHLLGLAYKQIGNFSRAFQYLLEELKAATKFNFAPQETRAYHQLGVIYQTTGDATGTMRCLNKIIENMSAEKVDELLPKNASAEDIRQIYEAEEWVRCTISEIKKNPEFEIFRLCKVAKQNAESALQKGKVDDCIFEAKNLLNLTVSLREDCENEKMKLMCDAYHFLGLASKQKENFSRAFEYFSEELKIAMKFNFILYEMKAYHQLGVIYRFTGDTEKVMHCVKKIIEALSPDVEELLLKRVSDEEIRPIKEAEEWAKSMTSEIKNDQDIENIRLCMKDSVQFIQPIKGEENPEEFIPNMIIDDKDESKKLEEIKELSDDLDNKSIAEEILKEQTENLDDDPFIKDILGKLTDSIADEVQMSPLFKETEDEKDLLPSVEKVKKSPSFVKQIEKSSDSKPYGFTETEKAPDKIETYRQVSKLVSRRGRMFDLDTADSVVFRRNPIELKDEKSKPQAGQSSDQEISEKFTDFEVKEKRKQQD